MTGLQAELVEVRQPSLRHGWLPAGRVVVDRLALLARHRGQPPDLVLRWNPMPTDAVVDVVVHLHGHSASGLRMNLAQEIEPRSGLDLADPARPSSPGRSTPTLLVLPRGHFYGGRSGHGYSFPALTAPGALTALVDESMRRFAAATGAHPRRGRLILTAHSGGGAALMSILGHLDPDEVHTFDALYGDPGPLIGWATRHQAQGRGALRVLFRPGEPTAANSRRVLVALRRGDRRFRVEQTSVAHGLIPRTFGWRLLADAGADLPGATAPAPERSHHGELESTLPPPPPATPPLCAAIARVAEGEFRRWRPGGGRALTESLPAAAPILREYYRVGIGQAVTDAQLQSAAFQNVHPWSAVFVSYVMRRAGAGAAFHYAAAHQAYIGAAKRNRLANVVTNPFWAFRATEVAPRVGDIVCAARAGSGATYDNIDGPQVRATHGDIVVAVRPGRIRVIGGNVSQTVGEKWLRTLPDGRLDLSGAQARFFAVLTCGRRTPIASGAAPVPGGAAPVPGTAAPTSLDGRVRRVMELLVGRYRYPVNGAAGLVGNLIAESGVMPNRIEGSREATPMRAADFSGQVRDFTPDQVRDRDFRRRIGPRLPGVGIAQWTTADRRSGLFRHSFQGRPASSAILADLEAQVDYLVNELRQRYAGVDAVLRAPRVSVADAADVVVLRFEVPAAVLNKPAGDPSVRAVLDRRRALAATALRIHTTGRTP